MDEFRIYATGVIFSVLAAGAVFLLLPAKRVAKPARIAAAVAVLLVLTAPLLKLSGDYRDIIAEADTDLPSHYEDLAETQRKQRTELARERFSQSVRDILERNGISPSDVNIYVTEKDGELIIYDVALTLRPDATAAERSKATRIVTEVFGVEPSVGIER
ncbi:MAG: stage III sporulation protein AF [Clostridia bacterium]|nr:stage III sporulation protein AF [Clostridia bacterium]